MSPGELTTPMPCRAARPDRGCTNPAYPSGISTAIPVATIARSPGPSTTRSQAARSNPGVALVGLVRHVRVSRGDAGRRRRSPRRLPRPARARPRRDIARSAQPRARGASLACVRPRLCRAAPRSARRGRTAPRARSRRSTGTRSRTSSKRSEKSSAIRAPEQPRAPRRSRAEMSERARVRVLDASPRERIETVGLVEDELHRDVVGADLSRAPPSTAAIVLGQRAPRAATRPRRGGRGRRRASPRASRRSPRRAASAAAG